MNRFLDGLHLDDLAITLIKKKKNSGKQNRKLLVVYHRLYNLLRIDEVSKREWNFFLNLIVEILTHSNITTLFVGKQICK